MGAQQSTAANNENKKEEEFTVQMLLQKKDEILKWAKENPTQDIIYHLTARHLTMLPTVEVNGWVVAGSAALYSFITANKLMPRDQTNAWKEETDTDIFILNSKENHRRKMGKTDFVHSKETTVADLLLNFDLPCCRIATNTRYEYWISAQCLASILTGQYSIPSYVTDCDNFKLILQKNGLGSPNPAIENFLHERLRDRIAKYSRRGFVPTYTTSSEVLPWMRNRFHYAQPAPAQVEEKKN